MTIQEQARYILYGDANVDALNLASKKLQDTFRENTSYWEDKDEQTDTDKV